MRVCDITIRRHRHEVACRAAGCSLAGSRYGGAVAVVVMSASRILLVLLNHDIWSSKNWVFQVTGVKIG